MEEENVNNQSETTETSTEAPSKDNKTVSGQNMNAALTYAFGWITGLIFLLTEKNDPFIRFHAAQSVVTFGAINILMFVPGINILGLFISPISLVLWVLLMYKAYNGELFKLPLASDFAEKLEKSVGN